MTGSRDQLHALNRASWDRLAAVHGQDSYYDSEGLVAGASSLAAEEEDALAASIGTDLVGLRVLHVQCHLGFDAITLARRGANVTGVDFSPVALAKAQRLADRAGVKVEWREADACDLPADLNGRFDLAWATIGILCWIADLEAWMTSVASTLAPSGQLVLIDGHPILDTVHAGCPYGGGAAEHIPVGGDYASDATTGPQVQFSWSLGEITAAAINAGLTIEELSEHTEFSQPCADAEQEPDNLWRLRLNGHPLPVMFTLRARRAAVDA